MAVGQRNLDLRFRRLRLNDRRIDAARRGCGDHLNRQEGRSAIFDRRLRETRIAQPFEHQVCVHVVAPSHLRNRHARNPRLRDNPTLLNIILQPTLTPLHRDRPVMPTWTDGPIAGYAQT